MIRPSAFEALKMQMRSAFFRGGVTKKDPFCPGKRDTFDASLLFKRGQVAVYGAPADLVFTQEVDDLIGGKRFVPMTFKRFNQYFSLLCRIAHPKHRLRIICDTVANSFYHNRDVLSI